MAIRLLSNQTIDSTLDLTGRVKVSGNSTDQYFYEGERTGVGVTLRLYDNSNNIYFDGYTGIVLRANQIGGSGGSIVLNGGNVGVGIVPAGSVALDVKEADTANDLIVGLTAGTGARAQIRSVVQSANTESAISFHTTLSSSTQEKLRILATGALSVGNSGTNYGTSGQVLTSTGNAVPQWATPTTGTITGSGTANKVTKFTAATAVGDGPITFSSNDSTFAGEVTLSAETQYLNFKKASTADVLASIISETDAGTGGKIRILTKRNGDTAINALTIDDNQDATFAGLITATKTQDAQSLFKFINASTGTSSTSRVVAEADAGSVQLIAAGSNYSGVSGAWQDAGVVCTSSMSGGLILASDNGVAINANGGTRALTISASDQSATFGGNIIIYNSSNAPYIDFVEDGDLSDSKARIQMDQIDTDNATLRFSTEGGGILSEQMRIDENGNVAIQPGGATLTNTRLNVVSADNYDPSLYDGMGGIRIGSGGSSSVGDGNYTGGIGFAIASGTSGIAGVQKGSDGDKQGLAFFTHPSNTGGDAAEEKMRLDADGNLGIGTDSPDAKLDVESNHSQLRLTDSDDSKFTLFSYSSSFLSIRNNSTSAAHFSLDSSGQVGIGTNSPAHTLDVQKSGDNLMALTGVVAGGVSSIEMRQSRGTLSSPSNSSANGDGNYLISQIYRDSGYNTAGHIGIVTGATTDDGEIRFSTALGGTVAEKMRIDENGQVGIGTTSPTHGLEIDGADFGGDAFSTVRGTSRFYILNANNSYGVLGMQSNHALEIRTNATTRMTISAGGNIGVGESSPSKKLVLNENDSECVMIIKSSDTGTAGVYMGDQSDEIVGGIIYDNNNDLLQLRSSNNNTAVSIDSSERVGIGTTSPNQKLEVAGRIRVTTDPTLEVYEASNKRGGFQWDSTNDYVNIFSTGGDMRFDLGGERMRITSAGNVGIGYTSPSSKLSVNGDAGFVSNSSSRVLYLTQQAVDSGNIIQFLDQSGNNVWEVVGRNNQFYIYNNNVGQHSIYVNPSTNNVSIKQVTSSYSLDVNGSIRASADVIAYSDRRVKENIKTIDNALDKVIKLRGVSYNRKDIEDKSTKIGVIAQEVKDILPEVVEQDLDDKYSVAYGNMAGVFIEAIKELEARVKELEKKQ